ncbi:MAG: TRAP transporter small permease [Methylococcales bacterium]|nr:TRAP transporter small permease [Methylococcales bacterium]
MMTKNHNGLKKLQQFVLKTEESALVFLLLMMIVIAVVQIVMRNFMGAGLIWAESLLRITVLWVALLGAMVASRENEHIAIDVLVDKFPEKFRAIIISFSRIATALICLAGAWYGLTFVIDEYQYGGIAFGIVPNWLCEIIIPFSLFIIAIRYAMSAVLTTQLNNTK